MDSDRAWQKWGEAEPYFGVLTSDAFRKHSITKHKQAFFESGEDSVNDTIELIASRFPSAGRKAALDFGCGVGRLTLPLARHYETVTGLDIAPGMLREAEANARDAGLANVRLALSNNTLSEAPDELDLVHSHIVLQHIPTQRGMRYMELMLQRLRAGGIACFHFTTDRRESVLGRALYWSRSNLPGLQALNNLLRRHPAAEPVMEMNEYRLEDVVSLYARHGINAPIIRSEPQGTTVAFQLIGQKQ